MSVQHNCHIAFAGGACSMTMVRAGEKLSELCQQHGFRVKIHYLNLWVSDTLSPNIELVVEMFPYYQNLSIPVFNGQPFLNRQGEDELLSQLINFVGKISSQ